MSFASVPADMLSAVNDYQGEQSEFVIVYGRRRVGKTFFRLGGYVIRRV